MKRNSLSLVLILEENGVYRYKNMSIEPNNSLHFSQLYASLPVIEQNAFLLNNMPKFEDDQLITVTITDVNGTILFTSNNGCKMNCSQAKKFIFQLAEANDKAFQITYFDLLTGLPNRIYFEEKLKDTLVKANSTNTTTALLFLDLDGFKSINDVLGHEVGDRLLIEVAKRISSGIENLAFVGRLGGDEFSFIFPDIIEIKSLHNFAETLIRTFNRPFKIGDIELNISASIGISLFPFAGEDLKTLLKNAEIAMYQAKKEGKNQYQIYTPTMDKNGYKLFLLKNDLKRALEENQFFVVYQPRVDPDTYKVNGAEALIRWKHPILGNISPIEFIPLAEESGLIIDIGNWMLKTVSWQVKKWQSRGYRPFKISVNISALQLLHSKFILNLKNILKDTGLEPKWLELEITESVLLNKEEQAAKTLEKLKSMGITTALDDFGTGYSALHYLNKYQFDVIKIDQSILKDIPNDLESYEIASAIVNLAQKLKKTVVAEGIETYSQLALVKKMGCNEFQGYICSKPIQNELFEKFLEDGKWMNTKK